MRQTVARYPHFTSTRTFWFFMVCGLLGLLGACRGGAREPDWEQLEAEGRVVDVPRGLDLPDNRYTWSDALVPLRVERVRSGFSAGDRLLLTLEGARGHATPFLLDTGSTFSFLTTTAPLASEVVVSRKARFRVDQGQKGNGCMGYLPLVRAHALEGRDLAVGLTTGRHSSQKPKNILGIVHLFHTQLEHDGEDWTLRSGTSRLPPMEKGWTRIPLHEGTPLVRVRAPDGQVRDAIIDTGAPWSLAVDPHPHGTWEILAADGSVALQVPVRKTVHWRDLRLADHDVALLIGMDVLTSRAWRLTFDRATWALRPLEVQEVGRHAPSVVRSTPQPGP